MSIDLMINIHNIRHQYVAIRLPKAGKTFTARWESDYQPLVNEAFNFNTFLRIVGKCADEQNKHSGFRKIV